MGSLAALFVPLLLGGFLFANLWDGDDEDDEDVAPQPEPEPEPEPQPEPEPEPQPEPNDTLGGPGNDTLTADEDFSGTLSGRAGDDLLTGNGGATTTASPNVMDDGSLAWISGDDYGVVPPARIDGVIALRGGAGNDTLVASGAGLDVAGGTGDDLLDLAHMTQGIVHVGAGDSVIAPTAADTNILWSVNRDATLDLGGAGGGQTVAMVGTGGHVEGSAHDDRLTTEGGNVTLSGGAGNDRLIGNDNVDANAPTHTFGFHSHFGRGHDVLDGGDGDDTIVGDAGDTLTGGQGGDLFDAWVEPGAVAHVTDFDPAKDSLTIHVDATHGAAPGDVTSAEVGGNTVIRLGGHDVMVIEGRTGLAIGVNREEEGDPIGTDSGYQDMAGNTVDPATLNVLVERYTPYM